MANNSQTPLFKTSDKLSQHSREKKEKESIQMMDKSREFTDGGEQTQRQQKSNRSNKQLPTAGPKKSVDTARTRVWTEE